MYLATQLDFLAEKDGHASQMAYECLDADSEIVPGSEGDTNGAFFYPSEATCNGISCPPYENGMELSCAVCTR